MHGDSVADDPYITLEAVTVTASRVIATLSCDARRCTVTPQTASRIGRAMPHLLEQVCVGGRGQVFSDEIIGTQTAHLVEHVALELLVQEAALEGGDEPCDFLGHTSKIPCEGTAPCLGADPTPNPDMDPALDLRAAPAPDLRAALHSDSGRDDGPLRGRRRYNVTLTYEDDLVTLRALGDAVRIVNAACEGTLDAGSVHDVVAKLHAIREV